MFSHNMAIASMFGKPSQAVQAAIQSAQQSIMATVGQNTIGMQLVQQAQQEFHDINYGSTAMQIDSMRSQQDSMFKQDTIIAVCTIGEIQNANPITRRVVMATPDVREAYMDGHINGYAGLYVNSSPTGIGQSHYDYRVFTSGVVQHVMEGDEIVRSESSWHYESTKEEFLIGIQEKRAASIVMANAAYLINNDDYDCTSVDNELL
ncbi:hypothetical protein SM033_00212 [Vibrio phage vB_VpaM_sm033]|nr:hypothetical protein SM033_00212 [Vibrio phage vB_VpaM_sm033]